MRTTLASEMLYAIARNQKKGILEGRIFELGNIFIAKELPLTEYPDERETLCAGVFGEDESFFTIKGLAETVADALDVKFTYKAGSKAIPSSISDRREGSSVTVKRSDISVR